MGYNIRKNVCATFMDIFLEGSIIVDRKKYRYRLHQIELKIKRNGYSLFKFFCRGKYYGMIFKQILSTGIISAVVSELLLFVLEHLNYQMGWSVDIKSGDFITVVAAGISTAGVFLALYCSNIAAVFSARYSRAPSQVFDLFMNNFIISVGVKLVLYYIVYSFCFIYQLWKISGTSYLMTGVWGFFTLCMVLTFRQLGQKSLKLTDAFKLLGSEYDEVFSTLNLIETRHFLIKGDAIILARNKILKSLSLMGIVEGNALSSGDFSKSSLLTFLTNLVILLWRYMKVKETLPFDSSLFPEKQTYPKWYEMSGIQKKIAIHFGGSIQPRIERDYFFLESWIFNIIIKDLPSLSQDNNMIYRRGFFQNLGLHLEKGIPYSECHFIADRILEIQKEWIHRWSKSDDVENVIITAENIGYIYTAYIVGLLKNVTELHPDEVISYASSCDDFSHIDFRMAPFSNSQTYKDLLNQIQVEEKLERKRLTPLWFNKQLQGKALFEGIDTIKFESANFGAKRMRELLDYVYGKGNYIASAYILSRIQEYYFKWNFLAKHIDDIKVECQKYHVDKDVYTWSEKPVDYIALWNETLDDLGEKRIDILYHLVSEYDTYALWLDKNMDVVGSQFAIVNEWMIDIIIQNRKDLFMRVYPLYKKITVLYVRVLSRTLDSNGKNNMWLVNQLLHPQIDFIIISGYALLWGEINGDSQWRESIKSEADPKIDGALISSFSLWKSFNIIDNDDLRFDWGRKIETQIGKIPNVAQSPLLDRCLNKRFGHFLIQNDVVAELYPIMILNKSVPLNQRYKSRYWKQDEQL